MELACGFHMNASDWVRLFTPSGPVVHAFLTGAAYYVAVHVAVGAVLFGASRLLRVVR